MKALKVLSVCLLVIFTGSIILSTSCKKEEDDDNEYSYRAAQDNNRAETAFNLSASEIQKAARQVGNKSTNDTIQGCPVIYVTGGWPKTVTLDYGTGCTGTDGITRKGQIVTVMTGLYVDSSSVMTSTFQNFSETINSIEHNITGTQVITNLGHNQAGHPHFSVDVTNASVSYTEGTINWTSQRTNEWIAGYDTYMNPWDDEYYVTGSANGTDINGAGFSVNITSPLYCKFCMSIFRWVVASGTVDVVNPGYPTITVDYGNGDCDLVVYIVINGTTYTVVLS